MTPASLMLVTLATSLLAVGDAANILALVTIPSPSHHIWNRVWVRALAERGHKVTTLSPDLEKDPHPNHRQFIIEDAYRYAEHDDEGKWDFKSMSEDGPLTSMLHMHEWAEQMCDQAFGTAGLAAVRALTNETFDLIIVEVAAGECFLGFVPYFGSPPVLAVTAFSNPSWASYLLGGSEQPSFVPGVMTHYSDRMTFTERLGNAYFYYGMFVQRHFYLMPRMQAIADREFGRQIPPISELELNMSMILVNTDVSSDFPRNHLPAMVSVGGLHVRPSKPLPKDIQKFLDEAPHGAILFSLGTNLKSSTLGEDKVSSLVEAFRALPQRVLWKWEADELPGRPANVLVSKWLPQSDILAHPNLRLFMTHGGLLSVQEAVARGVPMLGIPFFADQHTNIKRAVHQGLGEKIVFTTMTSREVIDGVNKVIGDPKYKENILRKSRIFHDQPQSPLDRAVFWIEYVIRHKGAPHLRSAALQLNWFQYHLLDIVALIAGGAMVALWIASRVLCAVLRLLTGSEGRKHKTQ